MSLTLYGAPLSPFVRKVRLLLAEKGLDYQLEAIAPFGQPAWYREISPLGRIPALRDGDLALADSSVICQYLEERYPEPPNLLGVAPKIFWMGPNAIIGGILFGIGIVLAGGCETGWMYRSMEGQVHFWVVGIGNVIGGTLVAIFWDQLGTRLALPYPKLNLLESFGPGNGLLLTFAGLALCLLLVQLNASRFTRPRKPNHEPDRQTDPVA